MFIIMSSSARAAIRKDSDFMAARSGEILYTGQFGSLCGIPVLFSSLVPDGMVIITDKDAVRFFVKKDASLEQDRNVETKVNTVVYERCGLIALVDDTSTTVIGKLAPTFTLSMSGNVVSSYTLTDNSDTVYYKIGSAAALLDEDVSGWTALPQNHMVSGLKSGQKVAFAEADSDGKCVASVVKTRA